MQEKFVSNFHKLCTSRKPLRIGLSFVSRLSKRTIQLKETNYVRKKLLALSIVLLTIGGSLTFTSVARADAPVAHSCEINGQSSVVPSSICDGPGATTYLLAAAGARTSVFAKTTLPRETMISDNNNGDNGVFWYNQEFEGGQRALGFSPNTYIYLGPGDACGRYSGYSGGSPTPSPFCESPDDGSQRLSFQSVDAPNLQGGFRIGQLGWLNGDISTVKEVWQADVAPLDQPNYYPPGIQKNVSVSTIANGGWTLCYSAAMGTVFDEGEIESACTGTYILLAGGYYTGQEPTPALTLPPDFLTPKTYGNPSPVTGFAPVAPATPITPTAPIITAANSSVIYNGVPQSAPYSVDQKSSCSTTYNGSSIPPVQAGSYAVSITCSANSLSSTATSTLTITKATPVISWSTPSAITSTTKLGASQLNAFSYIPGSFTYSASAGSTLPIGDDLVTATFTPTDTTDYTSATMTVTIHVSA